MESQNTGKVAAWQISSSLYGTCSLPHAVIRRQVICVLDALDECAESHQRILANRLAHFSADNDNRVDFRILISSRPDNGLRYAFDGGSKSDTTIIQLSGENEREVAAITQEINLVIDEEIQRFKLKRERSLIYDDMDSVLREKISEIGNRTYL
jgi:hypothetical protein